MRLRFRQVALLLAITVSLVATGFAHRLASPQDDALGFMLANGVTLAELCGSDTLGDGPRDGHCLACQVAGTAGLPPLALALVDLRRTVPAGIAAPRESRALARPLDPAHGAQGPPTV